MIINGDFVEPATYKRIYDKGYADGSLAVTSEIRNKTIEDMQDIIKSMKETATAMMWCDCEYACDRFLEQSEKLKNDI